MTIKRITLSLLYLLSSVGAFFLIVYGGGYYFKALVDRPHHILHDALKPGGLWGHGLGVIGTLLMLLMLLYLARKYLRFMRQWGDIGTWLDVHIWMGVTGPILVTLHTAFKFGGIVSISFWSMVAVALSGIFGRYLYLQIPRRLSGEELTSEELQERDRTLNEQIVQLPTIAPTLLSRIQALAQYPDPTSGIRASGVYAWFADSLRLRFQLVTLSRRLRVESDLNDYVISALIKTIRERRLFNRRMTFLNVARRLLHHWHLIHRPFAVVMYIIMAIHVVIITVLGYTWIF